MGQLRELPQPKPAVATGSPLEAWKALKRHLESRSSALTAEVLHTPIARCDEQLTKLLEERAHVLNQLRRMADQASDDLVDPKRPSFLFFQEFVDSYDPSDDEEEMNLV